ncbi:MAG: protein-export chaperone SecB [Alphaproteobacteria bacterium 16-39-46]|nr:MAG: protein-export chaperone SecB [Alphaproteobacteria bacterium 16-39-46]OZA42687.1 MAG: protein-export chaperone SecB [Alphaproteobacteria bacterium 17-39-52]HQS84339.1 protein-export chaperone SecB [Alphaproteobacteria bacterium]HQS94165.1 protein-export chaperone SecB [Alphaproteobacteria bacterium]
MSTTPPVDQPNQDLNQALNTLLATPLQVQAQYIKDLSFENPRVLEVLGKGLTTPPQLAVNIEVQAQGIGENHYEVILNTSVKAGGVENADQKKEDKDAGAAEGLFFLIELSYGGVFSLPKLPPEVLKPFLLIECPRLLFPFVRGIISDITKDSGLPPVLLAPVNFLELYEKGAQASKEAETPSKS